MLWKFLWHTLLYFDPSNSSKEARIILLDTWKMRLRKMQQWAQCLQVARDHMDTAEAPEVTSGAVSLTVTPPTR